MMKEILRRYIIEVLKTIAIFTVEDVVVFLLLLKYGLSIVFLYFYIVNCFESSSMPITFSNLLNTALGSNERYE